MTNFVYAKWGHLGLSLTIYQQRYQYEIRLVAITNPLERLARRRGSLASRLAMAQQLRFILMGIRAVQRRLLIPFSTRLRPSESG